MYELKTVSIKSAARVLSFVAAVVYIIFAIVSLATGTTPFSSGMVSLAIGIILFGLIGALLGVILSWGYNLASSKWGGLHLDFRLLEDIEEREPKPAENTNQTT